MEINFQVLHIQSHTTEGGEVVTNSTSPNILCLAPQLVKQRAL